MVSRNIFGFGVVLPVLLVAIGCVSAEELNGDILFTDLEPAGDVSSRDPRFFPLLKLYSNFPVPKNTKCTADGLDGHCLKRTQCKSVNGGTATSTTCANGLGVCCLIVLKWEGNGAGKITVKHSPSHLQNSNKTTERLVTYEIPKQSDVCQLKLDFKKFELAQPLFGIRIPGQQPINTSFDDGTCKTDVMTVVGAQNLDRFMLCGNNTGQHMYLHYGEADLIKIIMDTKEPTSTYRIQVTMIKCSSPERAPEDCTQYYTGQRGFVKSFNYPRQHLVNHKYGVCVKGDGSPEVAWSECDVGNAGDAFFLTGHVKDQIITECSTDSVTIPGFKSDQGSPAPIFCGGKFIQGASSSKPFSLYVNFDGGEPEQPGLQKNGCNVGMICGVVILEPPGFDFGPEGICLTKETCYPDCDCLPIPGEEQQLDMANTGFCLAYNR